MNEHASDQRPLQARRKFLKQSLGTLATTGLVVNPALTSGAFAASSEMIKVGLVGCGGRGTGAAAQTLRADPNVELVAMADSFGDHLEKSYQNLKKTEVQDRVKVNAEHKFVGFDAFQKLIDSGVDLVLLATPPHFRPQHLKACIDANKHVFCEKPVAVDAPGIRSVLKSTAEAKQKNLTIVSGLCWRYETGMQQMVDKIHNGGIGDIISLHSTRYLGGVAKMVKRKPEWSDMEYQMRNWYYYTWLSGDFNTEQFVHELDKQSWVMGEYPVRCYSMGGRQTRTGEDYGHIYDHFSTVYEYANGAKYVASTRHQQGCSSMFVDTVSGTEGTATLMKYRIEGKNPWKGARRRTNMHQLEHNEMYKALRNGDVINNGEYMANSSMMGIIARMSAYTGKTLTWEQAMNSKEDLSPEKYDMAMSLPTPEVATPGVTPFV